MEFFRVHSPRDNTLKGAPPEKTKPLMGEKMQDGVRAQTCFNVVILLGPVFLLCKVRDDRVDKVVIYLSELTFTCL